MLVTQSANRLPPLPTLVTATWNVYSVMGFCDLFENVARMSIMESSVFRLDTSNVISTSLEETTRLVEVGKLSSGKAELKFQSSSAEAPLVFWVTGTGFEAVLAFCDVEEAKSNMDVDGAMLCWGCVNGELCRGIFDEDDKAAKGSDDWEGAGTCLCC